MRRIMILLGFATLLGGCSSDRLADTLNTTTGRVEHPNTILPLTGLILSTPPVNAVLFGPCREEFMIPDGRKAQCELHSSIRGQTSVSERTRANGQAMAYQPGELQCWRTLGFKTECIVVAGPPRPNYLNGAPLMGAN
jgi:hypothetical protein